MKITINVIYRKDKIYKNNTAPIHIRFTLNHQIRYVSTSISISPDDWDFEQQRIKTPLLHLRDTQHQIDSIFLDYERKIKRLEALDIKVTFDSLFGVKAKYINCSLQDYFQKVIDGLESVGKYGSASKHRSTLSLLNQFHPSGIRFNETDLTFLRDFEKYLRGKNNNGNILATKFSLIKAIYNKAIAENIFVPKSNPFSKFRVGSLYPSTFR